MCCDVIFDGILHDLVESVNKSFVKTWVVVIYDIIARLTNDKMSLSEREIQKQVNRRKWLCSRSIAIIIMWIFQLLQQVNNQTYCGEYLTGPSSGPVLGLFMFLFLILVLFLVLDTQVHLSRSASSCYHLWLCVCWCISRWHNCIAKTGPLLRFMFCFAAVDKADDCIYRPGGERKGRRNWLKGELGKRLITHDTCSNILGNPQNGGPTF